MDALKLSLSFHDASEPLRKRAPTVDENGTPLTDFMVIIPGLRKKSRAHIQRATDEIHRVLGAYSDVVVFAELNLALNLLWVSTRPASGKHFEIADAIRSCVPDARLVSHV